MRGATMDHRDKIARSFTRAHQSPIRQGRLENESQVIISRGLNQQGSRTRRAYLLVRIDKHVPSEVSGPGAPLQSLQGRKHDEESAFRIRDSRPSELVLINAETFLKGMVTIVHRIHVDAEKYPEAGGRTFSDEKCVAEREPGYPSLLVDQLLGLELECLRLPAEPGKLPLDEGLHLFETGKVMGAGIDIRPLYEEIDTAVVPCVDPIKVWGIIVHLFGGHARRSDPGALTAIFTYATDACLILRRRHTDPIYDKRVVDHGLREPRI